ncbi:MAG: hypothetical protein WC723_07035, partial [Candidatus Omnitrophota bacterium]
EAVKTAQRMFDFDHPQGSRQPDQKLTEGPKLAQPSLVRRVAVWLGLASPLAKGADAQLASGRQVVTANGVRYTITAQRDSQGKLTGAHFEPSLSGKLPQSAKTRETVAQLQAKAQAAEAAGDSDTAARLRLEAERAPAKALRFDYDASSASSRRELAGLLKGGARTYGYEIVPERTADGQGLLPGFRTTDVRVKANPATKSNTRNHASRQQKSEKADVAVAETALLAPRQSSEDGATKSAVVSKEELRQPARMPTLILPEGSVIKQSGETPKIVLPSEISGALIPDLLAAGNIGPGDRSVLTNIMRSRATARDLGVFTAPDGRTVRVLEHPDVVSFEPGKTRRGNISSANGEDVIDIAGHTLSGRERDILIEKELFKRAELSKVARELGVTLPELFARFNNGDFTVRMPVMQRYHEITRQADALEAQRRFAASTVSERPATTREVVLGRIPVADKGISAPTSRYSELAKITFTAEGPQKGKTIGEAVREVALRTEGRPSSERFFELMQTLREGFYGPHISAETRQIRQELDTSAGNAIDKAFAAVYGPNGTGKSSVLPIGLKIFYESGLGGEVRAINMISVSEDLTRQAKTEIDSLVRKNLKGEYKIGIVTPDNVDAASSLDVRILRLQDLQTLTEQANKLPSSRDALDALSRNSIWLIDEGHLLNSAADLSFAGRGPSLKKDSREAVAIRNVEKALELEKLNQGSYWHDYLRARVEERSSVDTETGKRAYERTETRWRETDAETTAFLDGVTKTLGKDLETKWDSYQQLKESAEGGNEQAKLYEAVITGYGKTVGEIDGQRGFYHPLNEDALIPYRVNDASAEQVKESNAIMAGVRRSYWSRLIPGVTNNLEKVETSDHTVRISVQDVIYAITRPEGSKVWLLSGSHDIARSQMLFGAEGVGENGVLPKGLTEATGLRDEPLIDGMRQHMENAGKDNLILIAVSRGIANNKLIEAFSVKADGNPYDRPRLLLAAGKNLYIPAGKTVETALKEAAKGGAARNGKGQFLDAGEIKNFHAENPGLIQLSLRTRVTGTDQEFRGENNNYREVVLADNSSVLREVTQGWNRVRPDDVGNFRSGRSVEVYGAERGVDAIKLFHNNQTEADLQVNFQRASTVAGDGHHRLLTQVRSAVVEAAQLQGKDSIEAQTLLDTVERDWRKRDDIEELRRSKMEAPEATLARQIQYAHLMALQLGPKGEYYSRLDGFSDAQAIIDNYIASTVGRGENMLQLTLRDSARPISADATPFAMARDPLQAKYVIEAWLTRDNLSTERSPFALPDFVSEGSDRIVASSVRELFRRSEEKKANNDTFINLATETQRSLNNNMQSLGFITPTGGITAQGQEFLSNLKTIFQSQDYTREVLNFALANITSNTAAVATQPVSTQSVAFQGSLPQLSSGTNLQFNDAVAVSAFITENDLSIPALTTMGQIAAALVNPDGTTVDFAVSKEQLRQAQYSQRQLAIENLVLEQAGQVDTHKAQVKELQPLVKEREIELNNQRSAHVDQKIVLASIAAAQSPAGKMLAARGLKKVQRAYEEATDAANKTIPSLTTLTPIARQPYFRGLAQRLSSGLNASEVTAISARGLNPANLAPMFLLPVFGFNQRILGKGDIWTKVKRLYPQVQARFASAAQTAGGRRKALEPLLVYDLGNRAIDHTHYRAAQKLLGSIAEASQVVPVFADPYTVTRESPFSRDTTLGAGAVPLSVGELLLRRVIDPNFDRDVRKAQAKLRVPSLPDGVTHFDNGLSLSARPGQILASSKPLKSLRRQTEEFNNDLVLHLQKSGIAFVRFLGQEPLKEVNKKTIDQAAKEGDRVKAKQLTEELSQIEKRKKEGDNTIEDIVSGANRRLRRIFGKVTRRLSKSPAGEREIIESGLGMTAANGLKLLKDRKIIASAKARGVTNADITQARSKLKAIRRKGGDPKKDIKHKKTTGEAVMEALGLILGGSILYDEASKGLVKAEARRDPAKSRKNPIKLIFARSARGETLEVDDIKTLTPKGEIPVFLVVAEVGTLRNEARGVDTSSQAGSIYVKDRKTGKIGEYDAIYTDPHKTVWADIAKKKVTARISTTGEHDLVDHEWEHIIQHLDNGIEIKELEQSEALALNAGLRGYSRDNSAGFSIDNPRLLNDSIARLTSDVLMRVNPDVLPDITAGSNIYSYFASLPKEASSMYAHNWVSQVRTHKKFTVGYDSETNNYTLLPYRRFSEEGNKVGVVDPDVANKKIDYVLVAAFSLASLPAMVVPVKFVSITHFAGKTRELHGNGYPIILPTDIKVTAVGNNFSIVNTDKDTKAYAILENGNKVEFSIELKPGTSDLTYKPIAGKTDTKPSSNKPASSAAPVAENMPMTLPQLPIMPSLPKMPLNSKPMLSSSPAGLLGSLKGFLQPAISNRHAVDSVNVARAQTDRLAAVNSINSDMSFGRSANSPGRALASAGMPSSDRAGQVTGGRQTRAVLNIGKKQRARSLSVVSAAAISDGNVDTELNRFNNIDNRNEDSSRDNNRNPNRGDTRVNSVRRITIGDASNWDFSGRLNRNGVTARGGNSGFSSGNGNGSNGSKRLRRERTQPLVRKITSRLNNRVGKNHQLPGISLYSGTAPPSDNPLNTNSSSSTVLIPSFSLPIYNRNSRKPLYGASAVAPYRAAFDIFKGSSTASVAPTTHQMANEPLMSYKVAAPEAPIASTTSIRNGASSATDLTRNNKASSASQPVYNNYNDYLAKLKLMLTGLYGYLDEFYSEVKQLQDIRRQINESDDSLMRNLGIIGQARRQTLAAARALSLLERLGHGQAKLDQKRGVMADAIHSGSIFTMGRFVSAVEDLEAILDDFARDNLEELIGRIRLTLGGLSIVFGTREREMISNDSLLLPVFDRIKGAVKGYEEKFQRGEWFGAMSRQANKLAKAESWEEALAVINEIESIFERSETEDSQRKYLIQEMLAAVKHNPLMFDNNFRNVQILEARLNLLLGEISGIGSEAFKRNIVDSWQEIKAGLSKMFGNASSSSAVKIRGSMIKVALPAGRTTYAMQQRTSSTPATETNGAMSGKNVSGSGAGKTGLGGSRVKIPTRTSNLTPIRHNSISRNSKANFGANGLAPPSVNNKNQASALRLSSAVLFPSFSLPIYNRNSRESLYEASAVAPRREAFDIFKGSSTASVAPTTYQMANEPLKIFNAHLASKRASSTSSKNFRILGVQMELGSDFNQNTTRMQRKIVEAASMRNKPDLVVFPEDLNPASPRMVENRIAVLSATARENRIAVSFGYAFNAGKDVRYTVVSAQGEKLAELNKYNMRGRVIDINGHKAAVLICAESLIVNDSNKARTYANMSVEETGRSEFLKAAKSADSVVIAASMSTFGNNTTEELLDGVSRETTRPVIFVNGLWASDLGRSGSINSLGRKLVVGNTGEGILVLNVTSVANSASVDAETEGGAKWSEQQSSSSATSLSTPKVSFLRRPGMPKTRFTTLSSATRGFLNRSTAILNWLMRSAQRLSGRMLSAITASFPRIVSRISNSAERVSGLSEQRVRGGASLVNSRQSIVDSQKLAIRVSSAVHQLSDNQKTARILIAGAIIFAGAALIYTTAYFTLLPAVVTASAIQTAHMYAATTAVLFTIGAILTFPFVATIFNNQTLQLTPALERANTTNHIAPQQKRASSATQSVAREESAIFVTFVLAVAALVYIGALATFNPMAATASVMANAHAYATIISTLFAVGIILVEPFMVRIISGSNAQLRLQFAGAGNSANHVSRYTSYVPRQQERASSTAQQGRNIEFPKLPMPFKIMRSFGWLKHIAPINWLIVAVTIRWQAGHFFNQPRLAKFLRQEKTAGTAFRGMYLTTEQIETMLSQGLMPVRFYTEVHRTDSEMSAIHYAFNPDGLDPNQLPWFRDFPDLLDGRPVVFELDANSALGKVLPQEIRAIYVYDWQNREFMKHNINPVDKNTNSKPTSSSASEATKSNIARNQGRILESSLLTLRPFKKTNILREAASSVSHPKGSVMPRAPPAVTSINEKVSSASSTSSVPTAINNNNNGKLSKYAFKIIGTVLYLAIELVLILGFIAFDAQWVAILLAIFGILLMMPWARTFRQEILHSWQLKDRKGEDLIALSVVLAIAILSNLALWGYTPWHWVTLVIAIAGILGGIWFLVKGGTAKGLVLLAIGLAGAVASAFLLGLTWAMIISFGEWFLVEFALPIKVLSVIGSIASIITGAWMVKKTSHKAIGWFLIIAGIVSLPFSISYLANTGLGWMITLGEIVRNLFVEHKVLIGQIVLGLASVASLYYGIFHAKKWYTRSFFITLGIAGLIFTGYWSGIIPAWVFETIATKAAELGRRLVEGFVEHKVLIGQIVLGLASVASLYYGIFHAKKWYTRSFFITLGI